MRRAARLDANHRELVNLLVKGGASFQSLATIGKGCPDGLVGLAGRSNVLVEFKDGRRKPSERKLNADQVDWHQRWSGARPIVLASVEDVLKLLLDYRAHSCLST